MSQVRPNTTDPWPNGRLLPAVPVKATRIAGRWVLVHQQMPIWCVTNESGASCAKLLDGTHTVGDVCRLLSGFHSPAAEPHAHAFLEALKQAGFFDPAPEPPPSGSINSLFLHVTSRCNLQCRHCYAGAGPGRKEALSAAQAGRMVQQLADAGGNAVTFSGGEPLIWPPLHDCAKSAAALGLQVQVLTNGTLITPWWAAFFKDIDAEVQVSVDGWNAHVHESVRGKHSFAPLIEGLQTLADGGVRGRKLTLSCQLTPAVAQHPESMPAFAARHAAGRIRFLPLRAAGRATNRENRVRGLTPDEMAAYLNRAVDFQRNWQPHLDISTGITGAALERVKTPWCPVGKKLVIDSDASAYPCVLMMEPDFRLGSAAERPLADLMATGKMQQIGRAVHRRMQVMPACRDCLWRAFCQAGCAGLAWAGEKTLNGRDHLCAWRKDWYEKSIAGLLQRCEDGPRQ